MKSEVKIDSQTMNKCTWLQTLAFLFVRFLIMFCRLTAFLENTCFFFFLSLSAALLISVATPFPLFCSTFYPSSAHCFVNSICMFFPFLSFSLQRTLLTDVGNKNKFALCHHQKPKRDGKCYKVLILTQHSDTPSCYQGDTQSGKKWRLAYG